MYALLTLVLLAPAPKIDPDVTDLALSGCWDAEWGSLHQGMYFDPMSSVYNSPEFHGGPYSILKDNVVEFYEGYGASRYQMKLKRESNGGFSGVGWSIREDGSRGGEVKVSLRAHIEKID